MESKPQARIILERLILTKNKAQNHETILIMHKMIFDGLSEFEKIVLGKKRKKEKEKLKGKELVFRHNWFYERLLN